MIHYHGTPCGGKTEERARFLKGRHALVSFAHQDDIALVADVCQSFVLDNGAFTAWRSGKRVAWANYYSWVSSWCRHPGFDFALIPDVIDGSEEDNDALVAEWPGRISGVPVWHLHESIERLVRLSQRFNTVALGSSGEWSTPGSNKWWDRMKLVMTEICEQGLPPCRLHGLRMLNPKVFSRLPLSSADSVNASVNAGSLKRFGIYIPPSRSQRLNVIADRIESFNSAPVWDSSVVGCDSYEYDEF